MSRDPLPAHRGVGADKPEASTQALGIMQSLYVLAKSFAASSRPISVQLFLSWYISWLFQPIDSSYTLKSASASEERLQRMRKPKLLSTQDYYHPIRAMISQRQALHKVWPWSKTTSEKGDSLADLNDFSEPSTIPRTLTAASANSGFQKEHSKSPSDLRDPLGLQILQNPKNGRKVDIIFVHGLGGISRLNWSKNKDLELFWP